jgi:hypothetical protein
VKIEKLENEAFKANLEKRKDERREFKPTSISSKNCKFQKVILSLRSFCRRTKITEVVKS